MSLSDVRFERPRAAFEQIKPGFEFIARYMLNSFLSSHVLLQTALSFGHLPCRLRHWTKYLHYLQVFCLHIPNRQ